MPCGPLIRPYGHLLPLGRRGHAAPSLHHQQPYAAPSPRKPPSALPGISPTGGEITSGLNFLPIHHFAVLDAHCLGKSARPANLPTCGGDARQGRGGYHGTPTRPSSACRHLCLGRTTGLDPSFGPPLAGRRGIAATAPFLVTSRRARPLSPRAGRGLGSYALGLALDIRNLVVIQALDEDSS